MSINAGQARRVATLARLELGEAELEHLAGQLSSVLDYVDQLRDVPTDGVEPLAHPLPVHNVFRDDEPAASLPVDAALANAPAQRDDLATGGGFFVVPPVLD